MLYCDVKVYLKNHFQMNSKPFRSPLSNENTSWVKMQLGALFGMPYSQFFKTIESHIQHQICHLENYPCSIYFGSMKVWIMSSKKYMDL